jgi:hypothetical protein
MSEADLDHSTSVVAQGAVLERLRFASGDAFFGHRQDHGDADIDSGDPRQIDDLLFGEKLPISGADAGETCFAEHAELHRPGHAVAVDRALEFERHRHR